MYSRSLIVMLLVLPLVYACNKKKEEFDEKLSGIQFVEVSFSETRAGENLPIKVVLAASNECGEFNRFEENWVDENTVEVKTYLRYPKEGMCPQVIKRVEQIYNFTPKKAGVYIVKFYAGGPYLSERIVVR